MFVPIHDTNPLRRIQFQYVNLAIIAINVAIFAFALVANGYPVNECAEFAFAKTFGVIPMELQGTQVSLQGCVQTQSLTSIVWEPATLVSYMFLHGGFLHLFGNMLFLWVFGDNVEDALGHVRYVIFYLLCGIAGALAHLLVTSEPTAPLIGASGAISGVVVAYLLLHPRVHLWVLVLKVIPLQVPAFVALGLWIAMNVAFAFFPGFDPTVAWGAHVGGMIAGALLILVMRPAGVPLFSAPPRA